MRLADVFVRVRADMTELNQSLRGLDQQVAGQANRIGDSLTRVGENMSRVGGAMTASLTLPIVGVGAATSKLALDFDRTMNQIVGLTDVPREAIEGIGDEILAMAGEVGKGPQELAEAFYFVASAGFEAEEAMVVLNTAARASAAGLGDTQNVAQVLGGVINAYGKQNITAARAADVLTEAISQGTAEAPAFANVIGRVVPAAAAMGVTFDQVAAALAGMTLTGLSAEEAAVGLNQVFVSLLKPTVQAEEAMRGMGLSSEGLRKQLREEGLLATLRTLEERFAGNETASAAVFGNVRALRSVTSLLTLDQAQLNDIFAKTNDSLGRLDVAFDETEGPARELDRAMADLQAVGIELGQDVLPVVVDVVREVAGAAREFAKWWRGLSDETKSSIIQWAGYLAIAGPVLTITAKLVTVFGGLFKGVGFLAARIPFLGAALRGLLGPIGLVLAAAEGLKLALTEFTDYEIEVQFLKAAQGTGDFSKALRDAGEAMNRSGLEMSEFRQLVLDNIEAGATWEGALDAAGRGINRLKDTTNEATTEATVAWGNFTQAIVSGAEAASGKVVGALSKIPGDAVTVFEDGSTAVDAGAQALLDGVAEEAAKVRESAIADMKAMLAGITSMFETETALTDAWAALIERMADPYTEAERKADIFSQNTIDGIRGALQSGDPKIVGDTTTLVNNMLGQLELMEPGALASGEAVPPALRDGMDSQMQGLIDYIEEQTGQSLAAMSLTEARELGLEGIFLYAQGMRANAWRAEQAARATTVASVQAMNAEHWRHKLSGEGAAGSFASGVDNPRTRGAAAGAGASLTRQVQAGLGGYDPWGGGYWIGARWATAVYQGMLDNAWRILGQLGYFRSIFGWSPPTAGPLVGVEHGGESVAELWTGGLAAKLREFNLARLLTPLASAFSGVGLPSLATAAPMGAVAPSGGGIVTNNYNLTVSGVSRAFTSRDDFMRALEDLTSFSDGRLT